jgi:hypothetical protein
MRCTRETEWELRDSRVSFSLDAAGETTLGQR